VAEFVGETNLVEGTLASAGAEGNTVELAGGGTIRVQPSNLGQDAGRVLVSIRPERILLGTDATTGNSYPATVTDAVYHGDHLRVQLDEGAFGFVVKTDRKGGEFAPGDKVLVSFAPSDCWMLPA
jgi:putative spermidine/putrescine transport system ATP-binding protein